MAARRDLLAVSLREITADRVRLLARGDITPLVGTVMRRTELMIDGELRWHEELSQTVARAAPPAALTAGTVSAAAAGTAPAIADPAGASRPAAGTPPSAARQPG